VDAAQFLQPDERPEQLGRSRECDRRDVRAESHNPGSKTVLNCFLRHNPTSYSFQTSPPPKLLPNRLIALSHVLAIGSPYEVPNSISHRLLLRPDLVGK
jgi:hypothetical protein